MQLKKFLNPIILFGITTLMAISVFLKMKIDNYIIDSKKIAIYIVFPYIIYVFIALSFRKIKIKKIDNMNFEISDSLLKINIIYIFIFIFMSIIAFIKYIFVFGGITGFISAIFYGRESYDLQVNLSGVLTIAYQLNVLLPCSIMMILNSEKRNKYRKIIIVSIFLNLFYAILISARTLFITTIISVILYFFYDKKINIKRLLIIILFFFIGFQFMIWGQMRTSDIKNKKYANEVLINYFSESLENGYNIIDNNIKLNSINGPYWTFRPFLNLPVITKMFKIDKLYEEHIGQIPIKSRMDDFKYAEKLGVDPKYNTFSIYGYSYIDYGNNGIIFICITYVILSFLYSKTDKNKYFRMLFIIAFVSCLDILRTNGIFSPIFLIRILLVGIFYLYEKFTNRYKVR